MGNFSAWSWFVAFIVMVILLVVLLGLINSHIKELGQSICEQEHDMDYESYFDKKLTCKPKVQVEKYDGIVIEIGVENI